jgi:hypothetical protein
MIHLEDLENLPPGVAWDHRPVNPDLCLVSFGLINRFNTMNKPPVAIAGGDQVVECTGPSGAQVTLDGSPSSDIDGDVLEYEWEWPGGVVGGAVASINLPMGSHCITLTVRDPSGHIDRDEVHVLVQDTTPPQLTVTLSQRLLWPPNHTMKTIHATVQAFDLCGVVVDMSLVSVVSNQPDNAAGNGDGNTINDIQDVTPNTLDLTFLVRSERAAQSGDRRYTVTYQATDDSGNRAETAVDVIVPHNWASYQSWLDVLE